VTALTLTIQTGPPYNLALGPLLPCELVLSSCEIPRHYHPKISISSTHTQFISPLCVGVWSTPVLTREISSAKPMKAEGHIRTEVPETLFGTL